MDILRGKRIKKSSRRSISFISSIGFDQPITRHVININVAHMLSLIHSGVVEEKVGAKCLRFLTGLPRDVRLDRKTEDVHQMIEQEAIKAIGMENAGYMNLGKSRNDQVATALRMECRDRILTMCSSIVSLQEAIATIVSRHSETPFPGYTHLQHAQPVTLGHHFEAYFQSLQRNAERLRQAYARINRSPMGLAALAGTSVGIDRSYVSGMLGFDGLEPNSIDGVSSRDFAAELVFCALLIMIDLSRMAEELILWSSSEFGYVEVGDEYAATSSIMPQKKNPVVAETIRAKCSTSLGHLTAVCGLLKALPNSYNLDLQEVTPHLWGSLSETRESIELMAGMLSSLTFDVEKIEASLRDDKSTATELANLLATQEGVAFREAHAIVAEIVRHSLEKGITMEEATQRFLAETSIRVSGRELKIDKARVRNALDVRKSLNGIRSQGGANPKQTLSELVKDRKLIKQNVDWIKECQRRLRHSDSARRDQVRHCLRAVSN